MTKAGGLQRLLQIELLRKPLGIARQEAKLSKVAHVHDVNAVLPVGKLDYRPAHIAGENPTDMALCRLQDSAELGAQRCSTDT